MLKGQAIGNIGKDAETIFLSDGKPITNFSIGTNKKTKNGNETTWVKCSAFGERFQRLAEYLTKGKQVYCEGELTVETWEKDGKQNMQLKLNVIDIQLLGKKNE